ncbi:hypothetical protein FSP39_002002 [Pinctada imbricata]|uniref:Uncharacterized protein n=1 Tax=Pinctada imbricata TaxID=66713 RepID=A0AA88Y634_PINIB|nr:hypothetical protein FSP39_002002 [Pinctada imbricata]
MEQYWRDVLSHVNWSDPRYQDQIYYKPRSEEDILNESMIAEEMFHFIFFNGELANISELTPLFTRFGLCYTWNKNGNARTSMVGTVLNLHISMNLNIQHYSWGFDASTGIRMAIHEPDLIPDVLKHGFIIQNGVEAYINISPKKYIYPPYPFKAYGNEYCVKENSTGYGQYDREVCVDRCFADRTLAVCGCKDVSEPGDAPNCSLYQLNTCYYRYLYELLKNSSQGCHCPRPCEYTDYDQVISYGQYISEPIKEYFLEKNISTPYDIEQ